MHYVPEEVKTLDTKLADETTPDPASKLWDVFRQNPGAHTQDSLVDLFLLATERKNRTKKVEDMVKKTTAELLKAGYLYEFSGSYYLILNKV